MIPICQLRVEQGQLVPKRLIVPLQTLGLSSTESQLLQFPLNEFIAYMVPFFKLYTSCQFTTGEVSTVGRYLWLYPRRSGRTPRSEPRRGQDGLCRASCCPFSLVQEKMRSEEHTS